MTAAPAGSHPGAPRRWREWLGAAVVCAIGLLAFYRDPIFSGFREITGDRLDPRFLTFLLEHWYQVFAGHAHWPDPPAFHPVRGTLGYSDALFGQALPYGLFRLLGADPLLALQLMKIVHTCVGFSGMFALARCVLGAPWWLAAGGAFAFAFANGLYNDIEHAQFLAVSYCPIIVLLLVGAGERLRRSPAGAALRAAAGGLMTALLLFTSFYIGFFFVLLGALALVLYVLFDLAHVRGRVAPLRGRLVMLAGVSFATCLVGLVPFFSLYLPVVRDIGGRSYQDVMQFAPLWHTLVNYGSGSLLWSWIPETFTTLTPQQMRGGGGTLAPTPLLLVGSAGLWLWLFLRERADAGRALRLGAAILLAGAILLASTFRIGDTSGWWLIWKLVPGGEGIRAPWRIAILVSAGLVLTIVLCGTALLRTAAPANRPWRHAIVFALTVLMCVGQMNTRSQARIDRTAERRWLAAMPPPPTACRSFMAIDSRMKPGHWGLGEVLVHLDSLQIAHQTGLPTIVGHPGGTVPPHWDIIGRDWSETLRRARIWVRRHGIETGFCIFDRGTNTWSVDADNRR